MKAQWQLVWAATLASAAWRAAVAADATTAATATTAAAAGAARRGGSLLWATASENAVAGAGEGCAAVLLSPSWALLTTRCLKGAPPYHLTLLAPDADGAPLQTAGAGPEDGGWRQRRRVTKVARHTNQADAGALEFPGLALARADRPFALGAALRPAPVLAGALDDARRPLRCSIEGWKVQKESTHETVADTANFTEPTKTTIGVVLTHEQCRAHALVEQPSQFCVEAPAEPRLQDGSPLLCAGALVGMHYSATRYNTSLSHFFHLFTNASDLEVWLGMNVPPLKLVSYNGDGALVDVAPKHSSVKKSAAHALFLSTTRAASAAVAAVLVLLLQGALAL